MGCLVCGSMGAPLCEACASDVSSACPLVWLRGRPGVALVDTMLRSSLARIEGGFDSPPPFREFMEYVARDMEDDLRMEAVVSHLRSFISPLTDGDAETIEQFLPFLPHAGDLPPELTRTIRDALQRSRSAAPHPASLREIDQILDRIPGRGASMDGVHPSPPKRRRRRASPAEQQGERRPPPVQQRPETPRTGLSEDAVGLLGMAQIELATGRPEAAIQIADRVLSTYPESVDALLVKCAACARTDPERALQLADMADDIAPSPRTKFALAYAMHHASMPWGKVVQALTSSEVWREEEQAAHVLLGEAYLRGGKREKAREEFTAALAPGDERTALQRLKGLGVMQVDPRRLAEARDSLGGVQWVRT